MAEAPRIFLSYASEDGYWVEAFTKSTAFKNIGVVRVLDYAAESAAYGPLRQALNEQINRSAVVIAFVSTDYTRKTWTVAEWESSLSEAQRRRLVFVPIVLDADAIVWWKEQRQLGRLAALSRDYAYESFIDASGKRLAIRPEDTRVNEMIARLVRQIRQELVLEPATEGPSHVPAIPRAQEPSLSPLEKNKLRNEIYRELNAKTSDKKGNNGLPRDDARFGTMLGWQLARYEFAYDSPFAEAKAAAPSMKRDIAQLLKSDNAAGLFNDDFHVMTENVLAHYLVVKPTKRDAILIGIGALRSSLVGASKNPESNREIAQVAFSAIQDVDSSVISDKAAFFQKLQKTHPRNASELMDFLTSIGTIR